MVGLVGGDERREAGDGEVDTRERNQVRLELVQVDVQGAVETKRGGDRRHDLGNQAVQVDEAGLRNVELVLADIEDRLVVNLKKHAQADYETGSANDVSESASSLRLLCLAGLLLAFLASCRLLHRFWSSFALALPASPWS